MHPRLRSLKTRGPCSGIGDVRHATFRHTDRPMHRKLYLWAAIRRQYFIRMCLLLSLTAADRIFAAAVAAIEAGAVRTRVRLANRCATYHPNHDLDLLSSRRLCLVTAWMRMEAINREQVGLGCLAWTHAGLSEAGEPAAYTAASGKNDVL